MKRKLKMALGKVVIGPDFWDREADKELLAERLHETECGEYMLALPMHQKP